MPLIKGFRGTSIWKAFVLNSIAASLVIFIAITIKGHFDEYIDKNNNKVKRITTLKSIVLTLLLTFGASMVAYTILHLIVGFGGGMTVPE